MNLEADEIQRKMSEVRQEMNEDVVVLVESARSLLDWKGYVSAHPFLTLGAACAAGYALVPKKKARNAEAAKIESLLENNRVVLANRDKLKPKQSFIGGAVTALAGIALRTAVAKGAQHFQEAFSSKVARQVHQEHASGNPYSPLENE